MALLSGGIDSPVAAWMMMKRGCRVIPIYVELVGFSGPMALARASSVAERLRDYQPALELNVIKDDFLLRSSEMLRGWGMERYTCLICKRRMYRLAEEVARDIGGQGDSHRRIPRPGCLPDPRQPLCPRRSRLDSHLQAPHRLRQGGGGEDRKRDRNLRRLNPPLRGMWGRTQKTRHQCEGG